MAVGSTSLLAIFSLAFPLGASADEAPVPNQISIGQSAVGTLQSIGTYPNEYVRRGYTATMLANGSVFIYGAVPNGASANDAWILDRKKRGTGLVMPGPTRWDAKLHIWRNITRPPECQHTSYLQSATLLANNKILFGGGICDAPRMANEDPDFDAYKQLSLWNDDAQKWETVPALNQGRLFHTATLLVNGSVLFTGGESDNRISETVEPVLDSVELWQPDAAAVVQLPHLHYPRAKHTATLLADGRVLVAGGMDEEGKPLASVEIWDPKAQAWHDGPALATPRYKHTDVLLGDGRLMIIGGINQKGNPTSSVEIWDPRSGAWSEAPPLLSPLRTHSALMLSNGDVLVVGTAQDWYKYTTSKTMLWKRSTSQWQSAGVLNPEGLADIKNPEDYSLLRSKNGQALVFGNSVIMRWTPASPGWVEYLPDSARIGQAAALLKDGRILLAGGRTVNTALDVAEIYDPTSNRFTSTGRMNQPRLTGMPYQASLSSAVLNDGRVVIAGGWVKYPNKDNEAVANYAEIWNPATGQWSIIKELAFEAQERVNFSKLDDGRILFFASKELGEDGPPRYRSWIWDPNSNAVTSRSVTATPRANAAIAILKDGRVLIVGGVSREFVPERPCPFHPWKQATEDVCQDKPAYWASPENTTAQIWDSRTERTSATAYPADWHASSVQTMVLKNGNVVVLRTASPNVYSQAVPEPMLLWNALTGTWTQPPPLPADLNWPMTEMDDASLIAWAQEGIAPEKAQLLKPGASTWQPIPRFPQDSATVTKLPSGQLLALSSEEPYAAVFDEQAQQWRLRLNHFIAVSDPTLVELANGKLAVIGTLGGRKKITQIWNPQLNTWTSTGKIAAGHTTGKALRLASGTVLQIDYGDKGSYICNIWRPDDDSWNFCGSMNSSNAISYSEFALGLLDDGRPAMMPSSSSAFVFHEKTNSWLKMQVEWNTESYTFGVGVRGDKPFARVFDPEKNVWIDASVLGGKYYSMSSRLSATPPSMLWDPRRKNWAYINYRIMGKNGFWLPDGCAITGPPFKIYNPVTGKIIDYPRLDATWMRPEAMTVLDNGTVVVAGSDAVGTQFFHRKASCNGFEDAQDDNALMPGILETVAAPNAISARQPVGEREQTLINKLAQWWERFRESAEDYKWIPVAIAIPLAAYFVLNGSINWLRRKYPDTIFTRDISSSKGTRASRGAIRIFIYSVSVIIALPTILSLMILKSVSITSESDTEIPCRYVGVWSLRARGLAHRITLQADGQYFYEETNLAHPASAPVTGTWGVQGENMIWHNKKDDSPDINRILEKGEKSFVLLERTGDHTKFELIEPIKSDSCI